MFNKLDKEMPVKNWTRMTWVVAVSAVVWSGVSQAADENKASTNGTATSVVEKAKGAAVAAADQSVSAAKAVAADVKEISGKALDQTGQAVKRVGESIQGAGKAAGEAAAPVAP